VSQDDIRRQIVGRGIPLPGNDIDTDRILPGRYLKNVTFEGLEAHVLADDRREKPDHPFDQARYRGATILVVGLNFGCGSSREQAPEALRRWGIRGVVGESFAEIFFGNCTALGLPCLTASAEDAGWLMPAAVRQPEREILLDVENHLVRGGFLNQSLTTTRAHMVRAVFEGVAYNTRWMHQHVERFVKSRLDNINFVGGGAQSSLWCQILADVLDRTIRQMEEPRLANARGAALIAAVALGRLRWEDIPGRTRFAATYEPNPDNRATYDELFTEFLNIYKNNKQMYARLNGSR